MEISIYVLPVLVSALAAFALGALWYSPVLFGKIWQKELGISDEKIKQANMIKIFGTSFFLTFIMALGMWLLFHNMDMAKLTWKIGLSHGLYVGIAFVATSMGVNYLFQRQSFKLWLIDAGYQVVFMALIGTIIGLWH